MIATPFIAVLVAMLQTAVVFLAERELDAIVSRASRTILTGQARASSLTQAQFAAWVCNNTSALFTCGNFMIDVESYGSFASANTTTPILTFNSNGQVTNTWNFTPGAAGDIVVVRVMYQWPTILGPLSFNLSNLSNGNRLMISTAVFRNEPN